MSSMFCWRRYAWWLVLVATPIVVVGVETWTTAREARLAMEEYVESIASEVLAAHVTFTGVESCRLDVLDMSDAATWTGDGSIATSATAQFLDRNGTCSLFDVDENDMYQENTITGRHHSVPPTDSGQRVARHDHSACVWQEYVNNGTDWARNPETRDEYYRTQGCVNASEPGICSVSDILGGTVYLELGMSGRQEVCSSNSVTTHVRDFTREHPQMQWSFMGFQSSGLYRSYPAMFQQRNKHQCDGCQDPRATHWYVRALSSQPKAVIIVVEFSSKMLDQSGETDVNLGHYKDGVLSILSTISDSDYFNVIVTPTTGDTLCLNPLNGTGVMQMNPLRRIQAKEFIMAAGAVGRGRWGCPLIAAVEMVVEAPVCAGHKQVVLVTMGSDPSHVYEAQGSAVWESHSNFMEWLSPYISDVVIHTMVLGMNPKLISGSTFAEKFFHEISCLTGGIYRRRFQLDHISTAVLMSYYLREGMANLPSHGASARVRWTDVYDDGQGRGPSIAACAPMHDGILFQNLVGVTCASMKLHEWEQLSNHASEWHNITAEQNMCTPLEVPFHRLEFMRGLAGCEAVCNKEHEMACPAEKTSWRWLVLAGLVTAVLAGTFSALYTWKKKKNETEMFRQVDIKSMARVNGLWAEANPVKGVAELGGAKMLSLVYKPDHQVAPGLSADMTFDHNLAIIEEVVRVGSGEENGEKEDGEGGETAGHWVVKPKPRYSHPL